MHPPTSDVSWSAADYLYELCIILIYHYEKVTAFFFKLRFLSYSCTRRS